MKRLPDPARWERVCRANDASAAKAVLRDAGWGSGQAGTLHPLVQEGVDRCWSEACLAGSDRVLACLKGLHFLPSQSPITEHAVDRLLAHIGTRGMSYSKDRETRAWGYLLPHLKRVTDEQAGLLAVAGRSKDLLELLGAEAWVPRLDVLLHAMERLRERLDPTDLFDLMEYALNRFPNLGESQPEASLAWVDRLVEGHLYSPSSLGEGALVAQLRVLDQLVGSVVAGQGVEALKRVPAGKGSLLLRASLSEKLALMGVLGRHGCDPFWLEPDGTRMTMFFKRILMTKPAGDGRADPRCQADPWQRWVCDDRARGELEGLEAYKVRHPEVVRAWSSWLLEKALASQPTNEPTRRARL